MEIVCFKDGCYKEVTMDVYLDRWKPLGYILEESFIQEKTIETPIVKVGDYNDLHENRNKTNIANKRNRSR